MSLLNLVTPLHTATRRDYLGRMQDDKVHCMEVAKEYGRQFWDGERRYGYGGYSYDGRWQVVAQGLIDQYQLAEDARILDVGCGKGFLLYELGRLLPKASLQGFDISSYAIDQGKEESKAQLFVHDAREVLPFADDSFDLVISLGTLHNLVLKDLATAVGEIERLGRHKYIMVEAYRNSLELFNLQCWALTCESFFRPEEWLYLYEQWNYTGDYEFIYFG